MGVIVSKFQKGVPSLRSAMGAWGRQAGKMVEQKIRRDISAGNRAPNRCLIWGRLGSEAGEQPAGCRRTGEKAAGLLPVFEGCLRRTAAVSALLDCLPCKIPRRPALLHSRVLGRPDAVSCWYGQAAGALTIQQSDTTWCSFPHRIPQLLHIFGVCALSLQESTAPKAVEGWAINVHRKHIGACRGELRGRMHAESSAPVVAQHLLHAISSHGDKPAASGAGWAKSSTFTTHSRTDCRQTHWRPNDPPTGVQPHPSLA